MSEELIVAFSLKTMDLCSSGLIESLYSPQKNRCLVDGLVLDGDVDPFNKEEHETGNPVR